jgi:hydrogenase 3 maturation protease
MSRPATHLPALLRSRLREARRTVVLAIGSHLRGDDVAGLLVAAALTRRLGSRRPRRLRIVLGDTAPENATGELRRYAPTHLVVVDCADLGDRPGVTRLVGPEELRETRPATTHQVPLAALLGYLQEALHCETVIVGIQPGDIRLGAPPSAPVRRSAGRLATLLLDALGLRRRAKRGRASHSPAG